MTDKPSEAATPSPVTPAPTDAKSGTAWKAAVGIGSAALVAALMYANRRSRKK